jgi:OmpA-OmpF porin, OOP family
MRHFLITLFITLSTSFVCAQRLSQQAFVKANSSFDEQAPVVSPDGKTMFITVANHPQNIGGKRDDGDIWISRLEGNEWSAPVHAGNVLNDASYNAVAGFSSDGEQLVLLSHYSPTGKSKTQGIAVSKRTSSGWSVPENINIPYFLNRSTSLQGQLSKDGMTFVFSADSYSTLGAEDIYVTHKDAAGKWGEPKNLGRNVNTALQELSPSLSEDGQYLFFSSNGRQGYGSFDIYFSQRLDDTWSKWSAPVNMGAAVNSEGRELFYRAYPLLNYTLFTSTINSDGYGDIRIYYPPKEAIDSLVAKVAANPTDTIVKLTEIKRENPIDKNEKFVRVWGKILNGRNNALIKAEIHYQADSLYKAFAGPDGKYEINLPSVKEYVVIIEAPGYVGTMERLDIRTFEMKALEMNFKLQPIEVGMTVNLKNVLFQQGTSDLLTESSDELDMVAEFMTVNPKVEIELAGHTDNRGVHSHNVRLSKERVDKVKEYLIAKGISSNRITGKGYGGIRPIADNDAEETRKLNRRVEFTILKN